MVVGSREVGPYPAVLKAHFGSVLRVMPSGTWEAICGTRDQSRFDGMQGKDLNPVPSQAPKTA